jgi:hypothetical protein
LIYDTIPVKSASANVSFYINNSEMPNFELWQSCRKRAICQKNTKCVCLRIISVSVWWWPRGLRCGSAAVRLPGLPVQIPPVACVSVPCECCVLSGRGLCIGMITPPKESYRVWCVWVLSWSLDN